MVIRSGLSLLLIVSGVLLNVNASSLAGQLNSRAEAASPKKVVTLPVQAAAPAKIAVTAATPNKGGIAVGKVTGKASAPGPLPTLLPAPQPIVSVGQGTVGKIEFSQSPGVLPTGQGTVTGSSATASSQPSTPPVDRDTMPLPAGPVIPTGTVTGGTPVPIGNSPSSVGIPSSGTAGSNVTGNSLPPNPPQRSGIRGRVVIGPSCPDLQSMPTNDQCADQPYQVTLSIQTKEGKEVKQVTSGVDGTFTVYLDPGSYVIIPVSQANGEGSILFTPHADPVTVTLIPLHIVDVLISYDTGVR